MTTHGKLTLTLITGLLLSACGGGGGGGGGTHPPPPPSTTDPNFERELDRTLTEFFDEYFNRVRPLEVPGIQKLPAENKIIVPDDSAYKDYDLDELLSGDLNEDGQQELFEIVGKDPVPGQPGVLAFTLAPASPDLTEFVRAGDLFFTDPNPFQAAQITTGTAGVSASATGQVLTLTFNNAAPCGPGQALRVNGTLQLYLIYRLVLRIRQGASGPALRAEYVTDWKQSGGLSVQGACAGNVLNTLATLNLPVRSPLWGERELPIPIQRQIALTLRAEGNQSGQVAFSAGYDVLTQTQGGRFSSPPDQWTPVDALSGSVVRVGPGSDARGSGQVRLTLDRTVTSRFYAQGGTLTSLTSTALRFQAGGSCTLTSLSGGRLDGTLEFLRSAPVTVSLAFPERTQDLGCGTLTEPSPSGNEVTNLNDSGTGSLRSVLEGASPGSTITFKSGLSGTIALRSALNVTKDIVIDGPDGELGIVLSGQNAVQHLNVAVNTTVTVQDLTLTQGRGSPAGSIVNAGTLTLSRVVVRDSAGTDVGGIRNTGRLTLSGSQILNNTAPHTGGIASDGDVTVTGTSYLSGNSATGSPSVVPEGGGVRMDGGTLTLSGSARLSANSAREFVVSGFGGSIYEGFGGGVAMYNCIETGARLVMTAGSVITQNAAGNNYAANGGGIAAWSGCLSGVSLEGSSRNVYNNQPDDIANY